MSDNIHPLKPFDPLDEGQKYVVFKREDIESILGSRLSTGGIKASLVDDALADCWVIRKSDIHAAPAVFAYAQSTQNTIEFMAMLAEANGAHFDNDAVDGLTAARDAAQAFAEDALATRVKKLPS